MKGAKRTFELLFYGGAILGACLAVIRFVGRFFLNLPIEITEFFHFFSLVSPVLAILCLIVAILLPERHDQLSFKEN